MVQIGDGGHLGKNDLKECRWQCLACQCDPPVQPELFVCWFVGARHPQERIRRRRECFCNSDLSSEIWLPQSGGVVTEPARIQIRMSGHFGVGQRQILDSCPESLGEHGHGNILGRRGHQGLTRPMSMR